MNPEKWLSPIAGACAGLALATMAMPALAEMTLRLGTNAAPLSAEVQASKEFARLVTERSGGELTVEVFEGDKLGKPVSQIENLQLGTQEFHANVSDWLQQLDKDWATLAMPFLFSGIDHVKAFQQSDAYAAMKERLTTEHSIRIVADNWYRLPKVLVTTMPVFKPSDLEGIKLRMPNLETYVKTWAAFGAKPTPLAWGEAYLAMKTGTVDGMDSPLNLVHPQKFYQAAPFILKTDHLVAPYTVLMSEDAWQKLTAEQQDLVLQAGADAGDFYTRLVEDSFAEQKAAMLAEGAAIIEIDAAAFAEQAKSVMADFEAAGAWSPGMVDSIRGLAD